MPLNCHIFNIFDSSRLDSSLLFIGHTVFSFSFFFFFFCCACCMCVYLCACVNGEGKAYFSLSCFIQSYSVEHKNHQEMKQQTHTCISNGKICIFVSFRCWRLLCFVVFLLCFVSFIDQFENMTATCFFFFLHCYLCIYP